MRRFLVSYERRVHIEGVQYTDGNVHLNDSWVPSEFDSIAHVIRVVGERGKYPVTITWIDEQEEGGKTA